MKINQLVSAWQESAGETRTAERYAIHLPLYDAAKIEALTTLFPGLTSERVITVLRASALNELLASFAYEPGPDITGYDALGIQCMPIWVRRRAFRSSPRNRHRLCAAAWATMTRVEDARHHRWRAWWP